VLNNKTPNSSVVERMESCIAVFAPQLYAVVEGNFKNILAKARFSQLSNWLCFDEDDKNIAGQAAAITCDTGDILQKELLQDVGKSLKVKGSGEIPSLSPFPLPLFSTSLKSLRSYCWQLLLANLVVYQPKIARFGLGKGERLKGQGLKTFTLYPLTFTPPSHESELIVLSKEFRGENR
jgi:hypothetical protein